MSWWTPIHWLWKIITWLPRIILEWQIKGIKIQNAESHAKFQNDIHKQLREFQDSLFHAFQQSLVLSHVEKLGFPQEGHSVSRGGRSLLQLRQNHFGEEKSHLCNQMVNHIADRAKKNENLILLIDAGSTVLPIFRGLCEHSVFESAETSGRVHIVTNNLGGVRELLYFGSLGSEANARTKFKCSILEGTVNSTYEACLGKSTASSLGNAITSVRSEMKPSTVIAVVTGNYVSVYDGILARGDEHIDVKSAMISAADESYLIAPFGKLIPATAEQLNKHLNPEKQYKAVKYSPAKAPILVYSTRPEGYADSDGRLQKYHNVLQNEVANAVRIGEVFKEGENWCRNEIDPFAHSVAMQINKQLTSAKSAIWKYEFPHRQFKDVMQPKIEKMPPGQLLRYLLD